MDIEDTQYSSSSDSSSSSSAHYKKRAGGGRKFRETPHPLYRGLRRRNGGKWVCEVRDHNEKTRLWLGTSRNPEMAAVAQDDVAALPLHGHDAPLNFPHLTDSLPRTVSSSHQDIQRAASSSFDARKTPSSSLPSSFIDPENVNGKGKKHSSVLDTSSSLDPSNIEQKMMVEIPSIGDERDSGFVDEEAIYNMPLLLDSMAEGMLLTPLAMKKGFNWSNEKDARKIDFTLWGD